jgi:processive 1,2-diacylglycerol beta-glucosyltransferase
LVTEERIASDRSIKSVLIFSAAIGGGHLAAARSIQELAEAAGHRAVVIDGPGKMSNRLNNFLVNFYHWQLNHAPWSYSFGFWLLSLRPVTATIRCLAGFFWGKILLRPVEQSDPDVIISTYPVVTAALGRLAQAGRLRAPVIAIVMDYGVHPMWVSPDIDLHLVVSQQSRKLAEQAGGQSRVVRLPVGERFRLVPSRADARIELGLPLNAFIPLIVGGAWGVGEIEGTTAAAVDAGVYPVIVTGQNQELRTQLERRFSAAAQARILGWTDKMPLLMGAADCLIQNAGGVTCLEASELGLPIVIYQPIPGHGMLNARTMERSGAAYWARSAAELELLFRDAASGAVSLAPPRQEGARLSASLLLDPPRLKREAPAPQIQSAWTRRPAMLLMAMLMVIWLGFSSTGTLLAARVLGHPVVGTSVTNGEVMLAVRVSDPAVARELEQWIAGQQLPIALFVDANAAAGLSPESHAVVIGIISPPRDRDSIDIWRMRRSIWKVYDEIQSTTGNPPGYVLLDGSRLNLGALAMTPRSAALVIGAPAEGQSAAEGVLVINLTGLDSMEAAQRINQVFRDTCERARCVPMTA